MFTCLITLFKCVVLRMQIDLLEIAIYYKTELSILSIIFLTENRDDMGK